MNTKQLRASILGTVIAAAAFVVGADAKSDPATGGGVAAVYGAGQANSIEFLSTPDRIVSMASSGAPTAIWQTLEHGESVQSIDCIGAVAPLLYDGNAKNREIAAWWLRKRIFGVFGPGEVYEQTLNTLASDPAPPRRAYAANAIGEFLLGDGVPAVTKALVSDTDPGVRQAAAAALSRLNDDGSGAFTTALGDASDDVKVAAIEAAGRVSTISDAALRDEARRAPRLADRPRSPAHRPAARRDEREVERGGGDRARKGVPRRQREAHLLPRPGDVRRQLRTSVAPVHRGERLERTRSRHGDDRASQDVTRGYYPILA